eukprot:gene128-3519_t
MMAAVLLHIDDSIQDNNVAVCCGAAMIDAITLLAPVTPLYISTGSGVVTWTNTSSQSPSEFILQLLTVKQEKCRPQNLSFDGKTFHEFSSLMNGSGNVIFVGETISPSWLFGIDTKKTARPHFVFLSHYNSLESGRLAATPFVENDLCQFCRSHGGSITHIHQQNLPFGLADESQPAHSIHWFQTVLPSIAAAISTPKHLLVLGNVTCSVYFFPEIPCDWESFSDRSMNESSIQILGFIPIASLSVPIISSTTLIVSDHFGDATSYHLFTDIRCLHEQRSAAVVSFGAQTVGLMTVSEDAWCGKLQPRWMHLSVLSSDQVSEGTSELITMHDQFISVCNSPFMVLTRDAANSEDTSSAKTTMPSREIGSSSCSDSGFSIKLVQYQLSLISTLSSQLPANEDKLRDIVTQLVAVSKTYAIPEILKEIETSLIHEKDTLSSSKTRKTSKTQTIFTELINDVSSCTSSSSESSQPSNT